MCHVLLFYFSPTQASSVGNVSDSSLPSTEAASSPLPPPSSLYDTGRRTSGGAQSGTVGGAGGGGGGGGGGLPRVRSHALFLDAEESEALVAEGLIVPQQVCGGWCACVYGMGLCDVGGLGGWFVFAVVRCGRV